MGMAGRPQFGRRQTQGVSPHRNFKNKSPRDTVDPASSAEDRLVEALDHIVARALEEPLPEGDKLPQVALDALCELHDDFKHHVQLKRMEADMSTLQDELVRLRQAAEEARVAASDSQRISPRHRHRAEVQAKEAEAADGGGAKDEGGPPPE